MSRKTSRQSGYGLALQLSAIAGFVDAVGYIVLLQVYVANMSGNTIALGVESAQGRWYVLCRRAAAIPLFVLGMLLSRWAIYLAERRRFRFIPAVIYSAEALLLLMFIVVGDGAAGDIITNMPPAGYYFLLTTLTLAMGLQNTCHTRFGPFDLHTTHVTGTLAKFTDQLAQFLVWFNDRARRRGKTRLKRLLAVAKRQPGFRSAGALAAIWLFYAGGAVAGAFLLRRWGVYSLLFPVLSLIALALSDLRRPLALRAPGNS